MVTFSCNCPRRVFVTLFFRWCLSLFYVFVTDTLICENNCLRAIHRWTQTHRKKTSNLFSGNTDNVSVLFNPCGPIRQVLSAFFMATSISIFQLSWKRLSVKGHQTRVLEYCNLNSRGRLVITSLCEHNNCLITPLQHIYQSRSQKLSLFFIIVSFVCMCVWR